MDYNKLGTKITLDYNMNEPGGEERLAASDADLAAGHIHQGTANQLLGALTREPGP